MFSYSNLNKQLYYIYTNGIIDIPKNTIFCFKLYIYIKKIISMVLTFYDRIILFVHIYSKLSLYYSYQEIIIY